MKSHRAQAFGPSSASVSTRLSMDLTMNERHRRDVGAGLFVLALLACASPVDAAGARSGSLTQSAPRQPAVVTSTAGHARSTAGHARSVAIGPNRREGRPTLAVPPNHYFERGTRYPAALDSPIGTWRIVPPVPSVAAPAPVSRPTVSPVNGQTGRAIAGTAEGPERRASSRIRVDSTRHHRPHHRIDPDAPHAARDSSGIGFGPIPVTRPLLSPQVPYANPDVSLAHGHDRHGARHQRHDRRHPVLPHAPGSIGMVPGQPGLTIWAMAAIPDYVVEPAADQSPDRQRRDRDDCMARAARDSGFDPSLVGGGVEPAEMVIGQQAFNVLFGECLIEYRYVVR